MEDYEEHEIFSGGPENQISANSSQNGHATLSPWPPLLPECPSFLVYLAKHLLVLEGPAPNVPSRVTHSSSSNDAFGVPTVASNCVIALSTQSCTPTGL